MEVKFISKEKANKNISNINTNLKSGLDSIAELKQFYVRSKRVEDAANLREIEKLVEKSLFDFKEIIV
jgi:hypothetical protein